MNPHCKDQSNAKPAQYKFTRNKYEQGPQADHHNSYNLWDIVLLYLEAELG